MKLSTMLELYCPGLFADPAFAAWVNEWSGLGLATWHCRSDVPDEPGEMSDVFVLYDHGEGDSHPDGEGGMPRAAWEFIERKVKEQRLDYCLVRLINCEGRPTDFPAAAEAADAPMVVQETAVCASFNAVPPAVHPGDRVRYSELNEHLEGVVTGFAAHKGNEVILLDDGKWCYRHSLIGVVG